MKVGTWLRALQYGFIGIGVLACGYCAWVWAGARLFQDRESRRLDEAMLLEHASMGAGTVPRLSASDWGGIIGRIEIPRLGVSVMVVEGTADRDLRRAVGHIRGTAMPGEDGNVGIAGHRDTFFRPLRAIQPDDAILLRTLKGTYTYHVVSSTVVRPDDVEVLLPTGRSALTLVTCFPFTYVGSAPKRFIVRAAPGIPATPKALRSAGTANGASPR